MAVLKGMSSDHEVEFGRVRLSMHSFLPFNAASPPDESCPGVNHVLCPAFACTRMRPYQRERGCSGVHTALMNKNNHFVPCRLRMRNGKHGSGMHEVLSSRMSETREDGPCSVTPSRPRGERWTLLPLILEHCLRIQPLVCLGGNFCERGGKHIDCEYAKSYKLALRDKNNK